MSKAKKFLDDIEPTFSIGTLPSGTLLHKYVFDPGNWEMRLAKTDQTLRTGATLPPVLLHGFFLATDRLPARESDKMAQVLNLRADTSLFADKLDANWPVGNVVIPPSRVAGLAYPQQLVKVVKASAIFRDGIPRSLSPAQQIAHERTVIHSRPPDLAGGPIRVGNAEASRTATASRVLARSKARALALGKPLDSRPERTTPENAPKKCAQDILDRSFLFRTPHSTRRYRPLRGGLYPNLYSTRIHPVHTPVQPSIDWLRGFGIQGVYAERCIRVYVQVCA